MEVCFFLWCFWVASCSCFWWGFPAPFEAQLAFCTAAWRLEMRKLQLSGTPITHRNRTWTFLGQVIFFAILRNALQEESEVVYKQVSYRKQVVYFCQLPNFLKQSNSLKDQITVKRCNPFFFKKELSKFRWCGSLTQPINQWILIPWRPWQPSRAWSTSMAPRLLISCCHECRRWIAGGNGGKLRRVFFGWNKQGCFVWSWVVGLLVCWLCCIWRRSFWLKDFFKRS